MPRHPSLTMQRLVEGSAQYRTRYAEPESVLASLCLDSFDFVMVVPVCAEAAAFIDGYQTAVQRTGRVLIIAVLNARAGADESIHRLNEECFRELSLRFSLYEFGRGGWLGCDGNISLLVVDRFTTDRRLPLGQGVGLARKIGADIALEFIAAGRVRHPFFAMLDADASLPGDYFERIATLEPECSAALFPLWHEPSGNDDVDRATALYEIRLRYFLRGLEWANSPYAFHTVGSVIVVHALCYAQVRGVPLRQAGEDFYLLGKLSKLRPLARLQGEPVRIRSRFSDRVPFGTGPESAKLARSKRMKLYHPDCFVAVREVMRALQYLSEIPFISRKPFSNTKSSEQSQSAEIFPDYTGTDEFINRLSPHVQHFLKAQGAVRVWENLSDHAPNREVQLRRFHDWFDGFRTLKLIHHVRDHVVSSLPWLDAIRLAPFINNVEDDGACLFESRTELLRLEQTLPRLVGPSLYQ